MMIPMSLSPIVAFLFAISTLVAIIMVRVQADREISEADREIMLRNIEGFNKPKRKNQEAIGFNEDGEFIFEDERWYSD